MGFKKITFSLNLVSQFSWLAVGLVLCSNTMAQAACRVLNGQTVAPRTLHRGMYWSPQATAVGSMKLTAPYEDILGNTTKENDVLTFMVQNDFDALSFYDLYTILSSESLKTSLSSFIEAARACGVVEMNAVGAVDSDFQKIKTYQGEYPGHFDGVVVESEFWNASNVQSAFTSFISLLQYIRTLDIQNNGKSATVSVYLGWLDAITDTPEQEAADQIAQYVDRVYLHCYVKNANSTFPYCHGRIQDFVNTGKSLQFYPIFSAEGTEYNAGGGGFMGDWLAANSLNSAESIFYNAYEPIYGKSTDNFKLSGYEYYEYAFLGLYL